MEEEDEEVRRAIVGEVARIVVGKKVEFVRVRDRRKEAGR